MAVSNTMVKSALNLKYKDGVDENGKDINKTKKFSNVKVTSTHQDIFDTSAAISSLMKYPATEIVRADEVLLINEQ